MDKATVDRMRIDDGGCAEADGVEQCHAEAFRPVGEQEDIRVAVKLFDLALEQSVSRSTLSWSPRCRMATRRRSRIRGLNERASYRQVRVNVKLVAQLVERFDLVSDLLVANIATDRQQSNAIARLTPPARPPRSPVPAASEREGALGRELPRDRPATSTFDLRETQDHVCRLIEAPGRAAGVRRLIEVNRRPQQKRHAEARRNVTRLHAHDE